MLDIIAKYADDLTPHGQRIHRYAWTAHYGWTGLRDPEYRNPDGTPNAYALECYPQMRLDMDFARHMVEVLCSK